MLSDPTVLILMYFVLPLWLLAGFADWLCHRAWHIETTTGAKESLIHLLMLAEVGVPLLAAIFVQINASIIVLMIVTFLVHEATALWDVSYASTARIVIPVEQHVHSFLEMLPLMAIIGVASRHWGQLLALFGAGTEHANYGLHWKPEPLPTTYVATIMVVVVLFEFTPYIEELVRGLRANAGRLVPPRRAGPSQSPLHSRVPQPEGNERARGTAAS
jgi:hypothetical protein